MSEETAGELSVTFIDLLKTLEEGREGEVARSEEDVLTVHAVYTNIGIQPNQPFLLRFSRPRWRIIIKNVNEEVVEKIDVYQPYFFIDPVRFRGLWEEGIYKLVAEER